VPLGDIFENGSRDHDIVVRFAKSLHWKSWDVVPKASGSGWKVEGGDNYAKRVRVSGIKGLHPMRRGWRTGRRRFEAWVKSKKTFEEWKSEFRPNMRHYQMHVPTEEDPRWRFPSGRTVHWWQTRWNRGYAINLARSRNGLFRPNMEPRPLDDQIAKATTVYKKGDLVW